MASVNWLKATTQKAGGMKKHLGQEERENGNHSNPDIDKSLSCNNYAVGCRSYSEALQNMKERTKAVDKVKPPKRVRKDRVTCCFLELPCPRELTEQGKSDEFFQKAHAVYAEFFGKENVHGTFVHKDEVHEYRDKNGETKLSCEHAHTLVSAYTEDKGINGKAFETRSRIKALNTAMDEMCVHEFGIHLNTGERPDRKSVERLKEETELRQVADNLRERVSALEHEERQATERYLVADERATEREVQRDRALEQAQQAEKRTENAEKRLVEVNAKYDVASEELKNVLDKKARASEIKKLSHIFGETVEYNKTMLDSTRNIGNEAYKELQQAKAMKEDTAVMAKRIEDKEKSIAPMYRQAERTAEEARREKQRAEELRKNAEQLIEQRAQEIAEQAVREGLRGIATDRTARLEKFLKRIELKDGVTAFDKFEEMERRMEQEALERAELERARRQRNRGMSL